MECPRKNCKNEAVIHRAYGVLPCETCQKSGNGISPRRKYRHSSPFKLHRVQQARDAHGKDILQPFDGDKPNPDFAKAYPDKAPDYFGKEELEKI